MGETDPTGLRANPLICYYYGGAEEESPALFFCGDDNVHLRK